MSYMSWLNINPPTLTPTIKQRYSDLNTPILFGKSQLTYTKHSNSYKSTSLLPSPPKEKQN